MFDAKKVFVVSYLMCAHAFIVISIFFYSRHSVEMMI